ncbi:hypothetical protein BO70DRAFT_396760 [Aspergillus heteromorphus CBS 117.55]|uniref:Nuclear pore assembly and biogenesis-domain-containing protein n=1 Tax=Aspergillus heteromorphus CBS 117.55 TaxID=1448321 RepID=A0A317W5V3_9EURO|nr:uncharacterized protein BO70DRAFT_396760 [Aspergillus heteromorphus CBS 117.55]PWY81974.1 hypothetical protein BO70DRAFT_396760 [Aspergillus heteromorphus CBS 117.55]
MDFLPESFISLIKQHPTIQHAESLITLIQQHPRIQHLTETPLTSHLASLHSTYLEPYISHLRSTYLDPYVIQPLATLLASSMPDLVSVFILAIVLLISLKILDYARRLVMFWVNLFLRLLWWSFVLGVIWYVYSSGFEKSGRDLGWAYGIIKGFVDGFVGGVEDGRTTTATSMGWSGYATGMRTQQQRLGVF